MPVYNNNYLPRSDLVHAPGNHRGHLFNNLPVLTVFGIKAAFNGRRRSCCKSVSMSRYVIAGLFVALVGTTACTKNYTPVESDTGTNPVSGQPGTTCAAITRTDAENITLFPADNPWNTAIDNAMLDSRSDAIINLMASGAPSLKADFGSGLWENAPIGIPYTVVCGNQPKVAIVYRANTKDGNYGDESDPGPYPILLNAPVEGNGAGDSHVITVDVENKKLYELYNASLAGDHWEASSGAVFDLTSNVLRTEGWTSADAAGLPIFPGLVRYEEILKGVIDHPIRFTLKSTKVTRGYVHPARHKVSGTNNNVSAPTPMGMRIRLKADFDISTYSATNKIVLTALKKFGLILADIGSDMYITGAPDERWNNDDLRNLGKLKATDFEVVQMGVIK
jgi:hypothetical protein